jgi:putative ABC transport system permease protein
MFRWLPLVWANLTRRKLRFAFTFISILLAFLMFGLLDALRTSLNGAVDLAGADRLLMQNKINMTVPFPISYYEKVKAVPGVRAATVMNWFGGMYKDGKQPIQVQAVNPEAFLEVYPDLLLKPEEALAFKQNRQAIIVGKILADTYGWKVGQRIPLRSAIWRKLDGTDTWQFDIVGIYDVKGSGINKASAFFNYEYFNESLQFGRDNANIVVVRVADPAQSDQISARIDSQFANSMSETKTATERAFLKRFLDQMGDIGMILVSVTTAVFSTMLLVTANSVAESVRERTNEIGVLKTLGFGSGAVMTLILLESLSLTLVGGLVGLALASLAASGLAGAVGDYFPSFGLSSSTVVTGVVLMLIFGLVTGLWPGLSAMRLKIVDALRRG